jgi:hypothetical protein
VADVFIDVTSGAKDGARKSGKKKNKRPADEAARDS